MYSSKTRRLLTLLWDAVLQHKALPNVELQCIYTRCSGKRKETKFARNP